MSSPSSLGSSASSLGSSEAGSGSGPSDASPASGPAPEPGAEPSPRSPQRDFSIGEEYGTARKNLPPARIVAIALAAVVAIVAVYSLTHRAHALSSGTIDDVVAVQAPGQDMVMVAINVSLKNNSAKPSWIHTIQAAIDTSSGQFSDDASPAVDAARYFQAFPDLKRHALDFLKPEMRLDPGGGTLSGTIVVSFPVTEEAFNARKSLTVTVAPYDEVPVVIKK